MKILIVDDQEINRKLLRVTFQAEGMDTLEAHDGVAALEILKETTPDAIISDILMPNMDGYLLCKEVRLNPKSARIPFIIHTSTYVSPGDEKLAMQCGADKYLRKPAPAGELLKTIRDAVSSGGKGKPVRRAAPGDESILKKYSEALVQKLEKKNVELQELAKKLSERDRDRCARFFALSADMLCIADFDGRFQELSDAWESVLGYSKEEMLKKPYLDFVHPEDRQRTSNEAEKIAEGARTMSFENRYRCKDGSYRRLLWTAKPVLEERLIYAAARDVTERVEAEQSLRHYAEKLERANRELDSFSYSVSHDLRAPLRAIDGFSQALLEDCQAQLDSQGKGHLDRIRQAAQRMGGLIDDLLALSRLTRVELRRSTVDLTALSETVAKTLKAGEPARKVLFTAAPGIRVHGDQNLLRIALENLLGNAWKYTAKRPEAVVEFGAAAQEDGTSAFFVRDNGAGFDMAHAGKLFGAFQRLHSSEEFPGSGIGLATVARIVGRHGGRVWADGVVDEGAVFYFTLGEGGKIK